MRVHLLCDQKWRDLPNLTALKLRLEHLGHTVLLSTTKDARAMIYAFRPDCVVINHLFSIAHANLAKALRTSGIAVVVLPTEGAMRPELEPLNYGEFADFSLADMILTWNETSTAAIRARWGFDASQVPLTGCTRSDFYHSSYSRAVETREKFCARHDLDWRRPIVTWATQYGYAHLAGDPQSPNVQRWIREFTEVGGFSCYQRIGVDPLDLPTLHARGRESAAKAFFALTRAMPDVQFLIKPHPIEELAFYRRGIEDSGCSNIRFCPATYIWNVLNATDIQLHCQCTTALESWMWNRPTIELHMDVSPQLRWHEREQGSDMVHNEETLIETVRQYLEGREISPELTAYRNAHIYDSFGPADGRRNMVAGNLIDDFLRQRGRRRGYFHPIKGLNVTTKDALGASIRYRLGMYPNTPLLHRNAPRIVAVVHDKLIVRADVRSYEKRLAGILDRTGEA